MHDQSQSSFNRKYHHQSTAAAESDLAAAAQIAHEVAACLFTSSPPPTPTALDPSRRSKTDNAFNSIDGMAQYSIPTISPSVVSYGHQGVASKKIDIPPERIGVIIGKGGKTIKHIELQSGTKIQIIPDCDADPNCHTRMVELMGTPDAIASAEKLIGEVLAKAEAEGSGVVTPRRTRQAGSVKYVSKISNEEASRVLGIDGETIKNIRASSGANVQLIPSNLPPGDTCTERILNIEGTPEQIESAKQLLDQVISGENHFRNPAMTCDNPQQGYQAQPPITPAPPDAPAQQPIHGYAQPGAYSGPPSQYNMPWQQYVGYPPQLAGGYSTDWDQSTAPPLQQSTQGVGYDYYGQQPPQQPQNPGRVVAPPDRAAYNYNQPAFGYRQHGQGYAQGSYGGYHAPPQSGYGQPPSYNQQQGYGYAGNYGSQAVSTQVPSIQPSTIQQGYASGQPPSLHAANYPPQGIAQPSYVLLTPQMPYDYGPPQFPITVVAGYGQSGYPPWQPPPFGYGGAYGPASYGVSSSGQPGYGRGPPSYSNSYARSDGNAGSRGSYDGVPTQTPQQGSTVAKTSQPQS